jgi:hypothetical protein
MTVKVEGLARLQRQLREAGLDLDDMKDVMQAIAVAGAEVATGFAPNRTGRLAGSIRGNRAKRKAVVAAGNKAGVPYAGPVNYGWPERNIQANQFMQRADVVMTPVAVDMLGDGVDRIIDKNGLG